MQFIYKSALAAALLVLLPGEAALAGDKVWLLKQENIFMGQYDVYVSDAGIRAQGVRSHMVIVARPPKWEVTCYNTNARTIWHGSIASFQPGGSTQRLISRLGGIPAINSVGFQESGPFKGFGITGVKYSTNQAFTAQQKILEKKGTVTKLYPMEAGYFGSNEIAKSPQAGMILEHLFNTPDKKMVPVEFKYKQLNGTTKNVLITVSAKATEAPPGWLNIPTGLKAMREVEQVNMDATADEGLADVLGNIEH